MPVLFEHNGENIVHSPVNDSRTKAHPLRPMLGIAARSRFDAQRLRKSLEIQLIHSRFREQADSYVSGRSRKNNSRPEKAPIFRAFSSFDFRARRKPAALGRQCTGCSKVLNKVFHSPCAALRAMHLGNSPDKARLLQ